ncbi:hypothetical protein [Sphingomonas adhaesiva]|uniref:hypothetical protein n=1 Tax=Sphingomonas adhaesiva TaxID=28212 RepID=UPI002FF4CB5E
MMRRRFPLVFRVAAGLLLAALIVGQWWQRQSAGSIAGWVPAMAAVHCPAAAVHRSGTIADSARTLDGWGYAVLADLIFRDGRDRCRRQR